MLEIITNIAKLIITLNTPSKYEIIEREKKLLEEFNEKMKRELGSGWKLDSSSTVHPVDKVKKAIEILKEARDEADCPVVRDVIDELILTVEERLSNRLSAVTGSKLLEKLKEVIEEEGIEDWDSLPPEERRRVLAEVKKKI